MHPALEAAVASANGAAMERGTAAAAFGARERASTPDFGEPMPWDLWRHSSRPKSAVLGSTCGGISGGRAGDGVAASAPVDNCELPSPPARSLLERPVVIQFPPPVVRAKASSAGATSRHCASSPSSSSSSMPRANPLSQEAVAPCLLRYAAAAPSQDERGRRQPHTASGLRPVPSLEVPLETELDAAVAAQEELALEELALELLVSPRLQTRACTHRAEVEQQRRSLPPPPPAPSVPSQSPQLHAEPAASSSSSSDTRCRTRGRGAGKSEADFVAAFLDAAEAEFGQRANTRETAERSARAAMRRPVPGNIAGAHSGAVAEKIGVAGLLSALEEVEAGESETAVLRRLPIPLGGEAAPGSRRGSAAAASAPGQQLRGNCKSASSSELKRSRPELASCDAAACVPGTLRISSVLESSCSRGWMVAGAKPATRWDRGRIPGQRAPDSSSVPSQGAQQWLLDGSGASWPGSDHQEAATASATPPPTAPASPSSSSALPTPRKGFLERELAPSEADTTAGGAQPREEKNAVLATAPGSSRRKRSTNKMRSRSPGGARVGGGSSSVCSSVVPTPPLSPSSSGTTCIGADGGSRLPAPPAPTEILSAPASVLPQEWMADTNVVTMKEASDGETEGFTGEAGVGDLGFSLREMAVAVAHADAALYRPEQDEKPRGQSSQGAEVCNHSGIGATESFGMCAMASPHLVGSAANDFHGAPWASGLAAADSLAAIATSARPPSLPASRRPSRPTSPTGSTRSHRSIRSTRSIRSSRSAASTCSTRQPVSSAAATTAATTPRVLAGRGKDAGKLVAHNGYASLGKSPGGGPPGEAPEDSGTISALAAYFAAKHEDSLSRQSAAESEALESFAEPLASAIASPYASVASLPQTPSDYRRSHSIAAAAAAWASTAPSREDRHDTIPTVPKLALDRREADASKQGIRSKSRSSSGSGLAEPRRGEHAKQDRRQSHTNSHKKPNAAPAVVQERRSKSKSGAAPRATPKAALVDCALCGRTACCDADATFCPECSERMNGVGILTSPNESLQDGKARRRSKQPQQQHSKRGGSQQKSSYQPQPQLRGLPSPLSSPSSWSSEFEESSATGDSRSSASPVEENFNCVRCMARFTRSSGSSTVLCRRCTSS